MRQQLRHLAWTRIKKELPYIRYIQDNFRSKPMDFLCAQVLTAMGTHNAFLLLLPMLFVLYDQTFARHLSIICGLAVIFTCLVKDYLCLPRPPSVESSGDEGGMMLVTRLLHQKDSYHSQEFGAPSTHACTSTAIVVYTYMYHYLQPTLDGTLTTPQGLVVAALACYGLALPLSRVYCGMHSFTDITLGALMGFLLAVGWQVGFVQHLQVDDWLASAQPLVVGVSAFLAMYVLVGYFHPDPLRPCPCYDDSVSNAAVIVGVLYGSSDYSRFHIMSGYLEYTVSKDFWIPNFETSELSIWGMLFRIVISLSVILIWRTVAKGVGRFVMLPIYKKVFEYQHQGEHISSWLDSGIYHSQDHTKKQDMHDSAFESTVASNEQDSTIFDLDFHDRKHNPNNIEFKIGRHALDMFIKWVVYTGIGCLAVDQVPRLIQYLKL